MPPKLGVLLSAEYPMTELADLGKLSEDLGYTYFWYVDARYRPECYLGLAAVAAKTEKILLGTVVTDPFSRHPAITAVSIATLDEMSNGRAILGLGAGGATIKALGIDWKLPVAALRECVDVVKRLLKGEQVTHEGKVVQLRGGKLAFKPLRSEIPIYFATQGAQVSKLAGQVADGVLLANTVEEEPELYTLAEQKAPASEAAKLIPNEVVARLVLAGNAERVAARLAGILLPEVTQICIRPHVTPGQNVAEVIETFAKRVMPRAIKLSQATAAAH
jgi:5,10-methylenetetrahydromethanopterin reductase